MQGRNLKTQAPLTSPPKVDDLQRLLKAAQTGTPVNQTIAIPDRAKYVLKVQMTRASSGLGRSKAADAAPIWTLIDGIQTLWEYSTTDVELIFNLLEESLYVKPAAPAADFAAPAPAVVEQVTYGASPLRAGNFEAQPAMPEAPIAATVAAQASSQTIQLSGNLSELGVCELIQTISVAKMTGRLDITSGLQSVEIYFEDGAPRRASYRSDSMTAAPKNLTDEEVIVEAMTWFNGFFHFNASMKSAERFAMKRLDLLLMEGAALRDYIVSIEGAGLTDDSVPVKYGSPSEADFEKALQNAAPVDMQSQKAIYIAFDGKATLAEVVTQSQLPKSAWLPIVFNLSKSKLIGISVKAKPEESAAEITQAPGAKEAVREAFQQMLRSDTGLMSYQLFMHFLEVEYHRALKLRLPFSLIIIGVHKEEATIREELSSDDLKLVAEKIRLQLEPFDYVAHYQTYNLAVLLPHRPSASAKECVAKIINDFNIELAQTGNAVRFVWSLGAGCIPEDGIKLDALLAKVEKERMPV